MHNRTAHGTAEGDAKKASEKLNKPRVLFAVTAARRLLADAGRPQNGAAVVDAPGGYKFNTLTGFAVYNGRLATERAATFRLPAGERSITLNLGAMAVTCPLPSPSHPPISSSTKVAAVQGSGGSFPRKLPAHGAASPLVACAMQGLWRAIEKLFIFINKSPVTSLVRWLMDRKKQTNKQTNKKQFAMFRRAN